MTPTKITRVLATGLVLVAFVVAWRLVGPQQLGGSASYVVTQGNSMEPEYQEGDLVVLRKAGGYVKGDIVGYQSPSLGRTVLHRIHHFDDEGIVTKGDNNAWLDTDRPSSADVIGKAWLHVPGAGDWLANTRSPIVVSALVGIVALSFLLASRNQKRGRRARAGKGPQLPRIAFGSFTQEQKTWMGVAAGVTALFLLLGLVSLREPLVAAITADAAYEHSGQFGYSADVKESPVYPTGKVEPGRPVFLRLIDEIKVTFDYSLNTDTAHEVKGEALMFARVTGATGWKKVIPIATVRPFKGDQVHLAGTLNFDSIKKLSEEVQAITGLPESAQDIELISRVDVDGQVAGERVSERFQPALTFEMDALQLQVTGPEGLPVTGEQAIETFAQTQPGEVTVDEIRANDLDLLGISMKIATARRLSLVVVLLGLMLLAALWRRFSNPAHADEPSLIAAQYGEWLIPVETMTSSAQHKAVEVKSMGALVRLAELYERMILHEITDDSHSYFVEEDGVVYYYRSAQDRKSSPVPTSSEGPRFRNAKLREERRKEEAAALKQQLIEIEAEILRDAPTPRED